MDDAGLRVGDDERNDALDRLAAHFRAGRLTTDELDERTTAAQRAVTRGDLRVLERDLPELTGPAAPARDPAPRRPVVPASHGPRQGRGHTVDRRQMVTTYAVVIAALWIIWALTGADYPWPVWPMLGWGVPVALRLLSGTATAPAGCTTSATRRAGCPDPSGGGLRARR